MPKKQDVTPQGPPLTVDALVAKYLSENPHLSAALATFEIAQDEYRKSLLALSAARCVTKSTTNAEA
jgi:hypothetical protein